MNNLFQRDNSDKMLTAIAQAPNLDPISIWQINLLEDLMANYSMCSVPESVSPCSWYLMHSWWVILTPSFFFFMKHLCARFRRCRWAGLLRWSGHHFPLPCKPPCWYHLNSDASKETVTSGPCKGQCSPMWLNTGCTVLIFDPKCTPSTIHNCTMAISVLVP
jgi:hypothetical protein